MFLLCVYCVDGLDVGDVCCVVKVLIIGVD